MNSIENIETVKLELLKGKKWRYLRYLHASEALKNAHDWKDMLIIGAGNGLAEIALAMEYPDKLFHLTDYESATHSFTHAKNFIERFDIKNVTFGSCNILEPECEKFDIVYSIEVLEHIKEDKKAACNMNSLANKYVFCLVPFAETILNDNEKKRKQAFIRHEHYVVGYDENTLINLFPNPIVTRGCYWADSGLSFREEISEMDLLEIKDSYDNLVSLAENDIKNYVQSKLKEAQGIWVLSKTEEPCT